MNKFQSSKFDLLNSDTFSENWNEDLVKRFNQASSTYSILTSKERQRNFLKEFRFQSSKFDLLNSDIEDFKMYIYLAYVSFNQASSTYSILTGISCMNSLTD